MTEEQRKSLDNGASMVTVLDARQLAKWKEMLGKPFVTRLRPSLSALNRADTLPPLVHLLKGKLVRDDLLLRAQQVKALAEIESQYRAATEIRMGPGGFADLQAARNAAQTKAEQAAIKLLDAGQTRRVGEIKLQQHAARGLAALLSQPAVVTALKLTNKQTDRIKELQLERFAVGSLMSLEFRTVPDSLLDALDSTVTSLDKIIAQKMEQVLTPEQKDKLKTLLGQPFKGKLPPAPSSRFGG